jgi:hypothetical protein
MIVEGIWLYDSVALEQQAEMVDSCQPTRESKIACAHG